MCRCAIPFDKGDIMCRCAIAAPDEKPPNVTSRGLPPYWLRREKDITLLRRKKCINFCVIMVFFCLEEKNIQTFWVSRFFFCSITFSSNLFHFWKVVSGGTELKLAVKLNDLQLPLPPFLYKWKIWANILLLSVK